MSSLWSTNLGLYSSIITNASSEIKMPEIDWAQFQALATNHITHSYSTKQLVRSNWIPIWQVVGTRQYLFTGA